MCSFVPSCVAHFSGQVASLDAAEEHMAVPVIIIDLLELLLKKCGEMAEMAEGDRLLSD